MKKYLPIIFLMVSSVVLYALGIHFNQPKFTPYGENDFFNKAKKFEKILKKLDLTALGGDVIKLHNSDAPIIILNFWASWCGPCVDEFVSLMELRKKFSTQEILIVSISSDDRIDEVKKFVNEKGLNFPVVHDELGKIFNLFDITAIPTSIIFRRGKLMEMVKEPIDFDSEEFLEKMDKILNKKLALTR